MKNSSFIKSIFFIFTFFNFQILNAGEFSFRKAIPEFSFLGFKIDVQNQTIEMISKDKNPLTDKAIDAISKTPLWIRDDLRENLLRLPKEIQDKVADVIINPENPYYRDEIAFLVAHLAIEDLTHKNFDPEILIDNAKIIYEVDKDLKFVEIVENGDPEKDEDFFTTVKYKVLKNGSPSFYILPKEIYYWFVVHPKLDGEKIIYINPQSGGYAPPPKGVFWRRYLWEGGQSPSFQDHFLLNNPVAMEKLNLSGWKVDVQTGMDEFENEPIHLLKEKKESLTLLFEMQSGAGVIVATTLPVEKGFINGDTDLLVNLLLYGNGNVLLKNEDKIALIDNGEKEFIEKIKEIFSEYNYKNIDVFESDKIATLLSKEDFKGYKKLIIPSLQKKDFFKELLSNKEKIENWIKEGRVLEIHLFNAEISENAILPGGFKLKEFSFNGEKELEFYGYPTLYDYLKDVEILWDEKIFDLPHDRPLKLDDNAQDRIGHWVTNILPDGVMHFCEKHPSKCAPYPERAIQPARIAFNHYGNSGENQDMVGAGAKIALISNRITLNINEDHDWNEMFYEDKWIPHQTDLGGGGTHLGNLASIAYDYDYSGGSKQISAVFAWRGDGFIENITDTYTKTCKIKISLTDKVGRAVDGAFILFASEVWNYAGPDPNVNKVIGPGLWLYSPLNGIVEALIGDKQNHFVYIDSPVGKFPLQGKPDEIKVSLLASTKTCLDKKEIEFNWAFENAKNVFTPVLKPVESSGKDKLHLSLKVKGGYLEGKNIFNDLTFLKEGEISSISVYLMDENSFNTISNSENKEIPVFAAKENLKSIDETLLLPSKEILYFVLTNSFFYKHRALVDGKFTLTPSVEEVKEFVEISEKEIVEKDVFLQEQEEMKEEGKGCGCSFDSKKENFSFFIILILSVFCILKIGSVKSFMKTLFQCLRG